MSASAPGSLELLPGSRLGRYEIVGPIAAGATGAVYRALEPETGTNVAVKRMLEPAHRGRFEIEIRLLSHLNHPRVVRILDQFTDHDDAAVIVMELIEGTDLAGVLWDRGTPGLPIEPAVQWACEACEALQYVSEQQVVHGDVKPRNLILGPDGIVLTDFGIASQLGRQAASRASAGTPLFMAPEVFAGDPVSPANDVYAIAATLWTLITGSPPVYGEDTPLALTVPGATPQLEETLRHGLALDPSERTRSAAALADELGAPLAEPRGESLAMSLERPGLPRPLIEAVVRAAAGVFEAAAASIALVEEPSGDLVYVSAWGAGADETVGMRLAAGLGIAGAVAASGEPQAVASCRTDHRFAAQLAQATGYVPYTMLVMPLRRHERTAGVLSVLDRRDGNPYLPSDIPRGSLFCDLAVAVLDGT
jgi:eukaryotic-like serine/threonine-protein kinase